MGWLIWGIAALFYAYEFIERVAISVMVPDIMLSLHIDRAALGDVSAYYFYAYGLCQIPAGYGFDRFSARRILALSCLSVTLGSFLLAGADTLWLAKLSRALIGMGSACAFIGCLHLARLWLPEKHFPFVAGLTNLCGIMGGLLGGVPLAYTVSQVGWQSSLSYLGIIGVVLTVLMVALVRAPVSTLPKPIQPPFWHSLKGIVCTKATWTIALYGAFLVAPITAFVELWGIPFLMTTHHLSRPEAAFLNSWVFIGIGCGGPITGYLYHTVTNSLAFCRWACLIACGCLSAVLLLPDLSPYTLAFLFFVYGVVTSHMLIVFTWVNRHYAPQHRSGIAIGFTNMVIMAGGALFQPMIGWLMDRAYADYHIPFVLLPLCILVSWGLSFKLPPLTYRQSR
jgi:MFS family permease